MIHTRITVVCENSVQASLPLIAEHGLSFLIEREDVTLFDTGQGIGLIHNLTVLEKNIRDIKRIVLSHGHYDHTGGLSEILQHLDWEIPAFLNPSAFDDKRALVDTGGVTVDAPIGMRQSRKEYEESGAVFNMVRGFAPITRGISALSDVKRETRWKSWDRRLKVKISGEITDDPFNDDLSLLIETGSGPVVLLGCAHAGLVEILDEIAERTGLTEFHAIIGGTHLASAPEDYVTQAIETLHRYRVRKIGLSHCTGFHVACRFAAEFPDAFVSASVGAVFEF